MYQLTQFVGLDCFPISQERFYSYNSINVGKIEVDKIIATKQVACEIDAWTSCHGANWEFKDDDFLDNFEYMLAIAQSRNHF